MKLFDICDIKKKEKRRSEKETKEIDEQLIEEKQLFKIYFLK
jgi:hypothetical protein